MDSDKNRIFSKSFPWFYILFFCSGIPALFYQLIWQRALFTLYGTNIESVTIIVSAFMLGLGLGSLAGGWLSVIVQQRLLQIFGAIELCIGLFGYCSLTIFKWIGDITLSISNTETFFISFALICIPTLLMGMTLPILVMYLTRTYNNVGKNVGILYFINTCGAGLACFIIAFGLMRWLTQSEVINLAATINVIIGSSAFIISLRSGQQSAQIFSSKISSALSVSKMLITLPIAIVLSALAGFIALSYEIVWIRIYSFASAGKAEIFASVLGYYLLGIAFGALFCRVFCTSDQVNRYRSLTILAITIFTSSILCFLLIPAIGWISQYISYEYSLTWVGFITVLFGFNLPLLTHNTIESNYKTGANVSKIYFANIVGATTGCLITGFVLLDSWHIAAINIFLSYLNLIFASTIFYLVKTNLNNFGKKCSVLLLAAVIIWLSSPYLYQHIYENLQLKEPYKAENKFASVIENRSGIITVTKEGQIFGSGAYDGYYQTDLGYDKNGIIRAFFISAIHAHPEEVLMIGLSSGSWAQVLAHNPYVKSLTIIEINPGYIKLIPQHAPVASLLTNPKVKIVIDDGRRWLRRNQTKKFDLIIMNTTFHWRAYASNLLSKEFLESTRHALKPGGIVYYNTTSSVRAMRTAQVVFPYVLRFYNIIAASDTPIHINSKRLHKTLAHYQIDAKKVIKPYDEKVSEYVEKIRFFTSKIKPLICSLLIDSNQSLLTLTRHAKIITDDNMGSEWE